MKVKKELNGAKLTKLKLEKLTGIGRNTWSRKVPDFIEHLNNPIPIQREIKATDDVYYPNFSAFFDVYDGDINLIYNELTEFELQFQKKDTELARLTKEIQSLKKYKEDFELLSKKTDLYIKQAEHYKTLYEQLIVASTFPHLRKELGLKDNLLDFKKNREDLSLRNLERHFPNTSNSENNEMNVTDRTTENMDILRNLAPGLFEKKDR